MAFRLLAALGFVPHILDRAIRAVLRPLRLGWLPGGLLVLFALSWVTATTVQDTVRAANARPEPQPATVAQIADARIPNSVPWVVFEGLVHDVSHSAVVPVYSGGFLVDEVLRHYYLARDPADPSAAAVVRSALDDDHFRVRTIAVTVVDDPAEAARAVDAMSASGVELDASRYLEEVVSAEAPAGTPVAPSAADAPQGGGPALVRGRVIVAPAVPAEGGGHWYPIADEEGNRAAILRSPHAPDAIPMEISGTVTSDPFNLGAALDGWGIDDVLDTVRYSRERLIAAGVGPVFEPPSWLPAIALALTTLLFAVGLLVGYPVFRRSGERQVAPAGEPLRVGDELPVHIAGTLPTPHGPVRLNDAPGYLGRLELGEVARTRWRYWGARLGDYRQEVEAAVRESGGAGELVVHSPIGSVLSSVEPHRDGEVRVEHGEVHHVRRTAPAIRVRSRGVDAVLGFARPEERDRALAELRRPH